MRQVDLLGFALASIVGTAFGQTKPWTRHTIDNSLRGADGVRLADVNGDGHLDIATGWEEAGVTRLYVNPGPEKAGDTWPVVTVGKAPSVEDAVLVDLDGDGTMDIVSCTEGRSKTIFVHWAPAQSARLLDANAWKTEAIPATSKQQAWMFALPMDVDGKYGIDLVVGSKGKGGSVGWLAAPENARKLDDWVFHKICDAGWIMSLRQFRRSPADPPTVLVSDRKGPRRGVYSLTLHRRNGEVTWSRIDLGGSDLEVMFLDNRRLPGGDILVATRNGRMLQLERLTIKLKTGGRRVGWRTNTIANPFAIKWGKAVRIGDLDGDGVNDIVHTANTSRDRDKPGVSWLKHSKAGWKAHDISGKRGVKFDRIELVDLDGDGDLDVLTCEERDNLGVFWYENPAK